MKYSARAGVRATVNIAVADQTSCHNISTNVNTQTTRTVHDITVVTGRNELRGGGEKEQ